MFRNTFILLTGMTCVVILSCFSRIEMKEERLLIERAIGGYFQAVEDEDLSGLAEVMFTGEGIENIGLISTHRIRGWKAYRDSASAFFDRSGGMEFLVRELTVNVHRSGSIAWTAGRVDAFRSSTGRSIPDIWFTTVLEKRGYHWKLRQTHFDHVLID